MAKAYQFSAEARMDLKNITDYIASQNTTAARKTREVILEACEKLSHHPYMSHIREDLTHKPVRFWPVYSYHIIYDPGSTPLRIVRVVSGYRDIVTLL